MEPQIRVKEKSVIIHRDENGFGLRVGGQNPVFVDCVHENGAAWKAGVRKGDLIIKVNGTLVKSLDHGRVVQMIQNCSPFVNLTLHSPETIAPVTSCALQYNDQETSGLYHISTNISNSNNNPQSFTNLNWLDGIGDDIFQDRVDTIHQPIGVSKLVVSGPNPLISHPSSNTGGKTRLRNTRNHSNAGDNPFYYYKSASEKVSDVNSCNTPNSSMNQDQGTSRPGANLSIVRSRSSSKMSTRSTSGKYKPRNLRSRLVEDLRSLTITNSQATPSSLSTSPSSSDLSDCGDLQDSSRIDCLNLGTSNSSSGNGPNVAIPTSVNSANPLGTTPTQTSAISKQTTRRLEVIRELIDTEKTHTERLKHLNDLLYKPIKAEGLVPADQLKMVFSCHKTLFKIHRQIYKILSAAQQNTSDCHPEPLVGKALVDIFDGELGRRLEKAASTFCACQSTNTELLNRFTRKDTKAGEFLAQVANQQMLGRLGIKDLLASCFQRLTKYPLLLDNLLKATPNPSSGIHTKSLSTGSIATSFTSSIINSTNEDLSTNDSFIQDGSTELVPVERSKTSDLTPASNNNKDDMTATSVTSSLATAPLNDPYAFERYCISKALHQSRQILIHVNDAVKRAISHNKLREIWRKTDISVIYRAPSMEKDKEKSQSEKEKKPLPVIDIETQQMLHEGPLTLRMARRTFDVYVLLLTQYLIILTREGQDKYKLKYFTADGKLAPLSPIFNIDEHLATRDTATDENGFYLLCKHKDDSRIYEFASQSPAERAKWKEKIHMAQLYNFAAAPDDDNTLTRYRELITLETSSNL